MAPKFQGNSTNPFWGYRVWREDFWNDDDCWWITSCAAWDLEFLFTGQYPEAMSNFGETPSDATALGFLNWAMEYDIPGDQVVTGGWGL